MPAKKEKAAPWTVYILKCGDGSLYTGVTNNLDQRVDKHASGRGARYTKNRGPFEVLYTELHKTQGSALRRERQIKALSRPVKLALIAL